MVLRIKQQEINILWNIWSYPSHRVNSCEHINQIKLIFFFSPSPLGENNKNQRGLRWWYSGWGSSRQCGGRGWDPWSGKIPHAWERLSPRGTTAEPSKLHVLSSGAQSPHSTAREAAAMRRQRAAERAAPTRCSERKPALQRRPGTAKNK